MKTRQKLFVSRSAFTLMELLVVIVILAVLVAIALPTIAQVKVKGYETVTLSNMRQMSVALVAYSGDNNFDLPGRVSQPDDGSPPPDKWPRLLKPYVQNVQIYGSPLRDMDGKSYKVSNPEDYLDNDVNRTCYIYNGGNDVVPLKSGESYPKLNRISHPSETILLGIPRPQKNNFYMDFSEGGGNNNEVLNKQAFPIGSSYVFCDGSARWLKPAGKEENKAEPKNGATYTDWLWLFDKSRTEVIQ